VVAAGAGGRAEGGSGSDLAVVATDEATADGGSGNDFVVGTRAGALYGGSGGDIVANTAGTPKIDCGSAFDRVSPNGATDVRRCEQTI
jgi:hypothetical protein